jgi:hypothetical protein
MTILSLFFIFVLKGRRWIWPFFALFHSLRHELLLYLLPDWRRHELVFNLPFIYHFLYSMQGFSTERVVNLKSSPTNYLLMRVNYRFDIFRRNILQA